MEPELDTVIDRYERALEARDDGDDARAYELIAGLLVELEPLRSKDAALLRARIAISRAEVATRTQSADEARELAVDAVERARKVRRSEPMLEPSALYMLGKAERPSRSHRFGAGSFDRSLALWRRLSGDDSPYTFDAARSLASACLKMADWERAQIGLDLVIARAPEPSYFLDRAIVRERLGTLDAASADLDRWLAIATGVPREERLRGLLVASRIAATGGDEETASSALAEANGLATDDDPQLRAAILEGAAWLHVRRETPWFLAAEVLLRRAASLALTPPIVDTGWRIATTWRHGVAEDLVQPAFAVLDIEAALQEWDAEALSYTARPKHQRTQLVVGGAPTSIERLGDARWRDLCVQRLFSTFHAEQFKGHEPNFVAPVEVKTLRLPPEHVLDLLPSLRVPKWATTSTVMVSSLGEVEATTLAEIAILATRALPAEAAVAAVQRALPSLGRDVAREMLARPRTKITLSPSVAIPLIPEG